MGKSKEYRTKMTPNDRKDQNNRKAEATPRQCSQITKKIGMQRLRGPTNYNPLLMPAQNNSINYRRFFIDHCTDILNHAGRCETINCPVSNCTAMKRVWEHTLSCQARQIGLDCKVCSNFMILFSYHAKNCRKTSCDMLYCNMIKNSQHQHRH